MVVLTVIIGILGVFFSTWGSQTRGVWSRKISTVGGLLWLSGVICAFVVFSLAHAFLYLLGTFITAALMQRVLPRSSHI